MRTGLWVHRMPILYEEEDALRYGERLKKMIGMLSGTTHRVAESLIGLWLDMLEAGIIKSGIKRLVLITRVLERRSER